MSSLAVRRHLRIRHRADCPRVSATGAPASSAPPRREPPETQRSIKSRQPSTADRRAASQATACRDRRFAPARAGCPCPSIFQLFHFDFIFHRPCFTSSVQTRRSPPCRARAAADTRGCALGSPCAARRRCGKRALRHFELRLLAEQDQSRYARASAARSDHDYVNVARFRIRFRISLTKHFF